MPSNLFWSWPSFASQPQTGWRQGWRDAWRDAWKEAWSSPEIDVDGRGTASVRSLPDPDSALDLNDLSQRSVIALAFAAAHLVARLAAAHGLALAAVRVIIDPAHRAGPACRFAGNGAGRQRGCQRHAAGDFGATLASLATDAARRRRHLRPRGACSPAPPAGAELQLGMRSACGRSGFTRSAEPEPNEYADSAPRNSRESVAVYPIIDENNSSEICNTLNPSQN